MCLSTCENEGLKQNENDGLREALDSLVRNRISRADIVIPIARRGIRVLELSSYADKLDGKILIYDSVRFHLRELKDKTVVLFDEGVYSGRTLLKAKRELRDLSNKLNLNFSDKISTTSLIVNADKVQRYPDYYSLSVNSDIYDYISQTLDYMILSSGKPMDVDHLIAKIRIPENEMLNFFGTLKKEFYAIEPGHSGIYNNVRMFTIDLNLDEVRSIFSFFIPDISGFPRLFDGGVKKIRIYQKDETIHIVPIVYPAFEVREDAQLHKEKCPIWPILGNASLCEVRPKFADDEKNMRNIICSNCIVNGLNINLTLEFLIKLRKFIKYEFLELDDKCFQIVSHDESFKLIKAFNEIIDACLEAEENIEIGEIKSKKFNLITEPMEKVDPLINKEFRFKSYEAILEVLFKNKEINNGLFLRFDTAGVKEHDKKLDALTYEQLCDGLINTEKTEFSEGMDIAMDIGSLKPVMQYDAVKINCEGNYYNAIVRMYALSGEETERSLRCILAFLGRIDFGQNQPGSK
jgi:hypoxanthine phosphoribosyltransferase